MGENVVCPSVPEAQGEVEHRESRGKSWLEMLPNFRDAQILPHQLPFCPITLEFGPSAISARHRGGQEKAKSVSCGRGGGRDTPVPRCAGWGGHGAALCMSGAWLSFRNRQNTSTASGCPHWAGSQEGQGQEG